MKRSAFHIIIFMLLVFAPGQLFAGEIVINAVGDVMLAGRWAGVIKKKGYDYPFGGTKGELAKGDINLANLESPASRGGREFTEKKFRFKSEPQVIPAIKKAGFNIVTMANNHSMDFGQKALAETMANLKSAGVSWVGAGVNLEAARRSVIFDVKGRKVAFLGYSLTQPVEFFAAADGAGTAPGYSRLFEPDIAAARQAADYVVVSFHWGTEGSGQVKAYQREAAHKAIAAGADVIIGHHPHVLQGIERYKSGLIFYSLGNFAFASKGNTAKSAAMVRLRLNGTSRVAEILPLDVYNNRVAFQPRVLSGKPAADVIADLNRLSRTMKTTVQARDNRYVIEF